MASGEIPPSNPPTQLRDVVWCSGADGALNSKVGNTSVQVIAVQTIGKDGAVKRDVVACPYLLRNEGNTCEVSHTSFPYRHRPCLYADPVRETESTDDDKAFKEFLSELIGPEGSQQQENFIEAFEDYARRHPY